MQKPIIGLVGAVGSGKSSVADYFSQVGCGVVDADRINHEILSLPSTIARIAAIWGHDILTGEGAIDRSALGQIVFADPGQLKKLTEILHPAILDRQDLMIRRYQEDTDIKAIILDVPLLIETGWESRCDYIIYVDADESIRHERVRSRRGWDDQKIKNVENSQILLDRKREIADYTISNNSCISSLIPQVEKIFLEIITKRG